ncbi:EAL domain-containing protein [Paraburkholderia tropica]|uniref:EAL domain-containing protein n=1 Tax=Paraburkholderia tropica TaxID=92647 RepID=UPI0017E18E25|nr:sensor c-di-GMP phosphodiesterase-like protein [Paraburkholderia tropica]
MASGTKYWIASLLAATVSMALPVALGVTLTWLAGRQAQVQHLNALATDIGRRSSETRDEVMRALSEVQSARRSGSTTVATAQDPCSERELARMRNIIATKPMLKGMGYLADGALRCATMTNLAQRQPLGHPERIDSSGMKSWSAVNLPSLPGTTFNVNARGNDAIFIAPGVVLDILPETSSVSFSHISFPSQSVVRSHGYYDPAWTRRFQQGDTHFVDRDRLVVAVRTEKESDVIFASMPVTWWQTLSDGPARSAIPLSVLIGALLALLSWIAIGRYFSLSNQIRIALKNDEFYLLYQPVMDLRTLRCVGAEALIRWKRRDGRPVGPSEFIPVAETSNLIVNITQKVIELVARDASLLIKNHPDLHIAINVSAADLNSAETPAKLNDMLAAMNALPENIVIEATERGFMNPEQATDVLLNVRAQGFKVAIDDFGTGNSSLSYLATYKLDFLKIDRMFVDSIATTAPTRQVTMHIIEMAHSLNLQMIAEGVETVEQRDILRAAGVQFAQGWVFGKPMPIQALAAFVAANPGVSPQPA